MAAMSVLESMSYGIWSPRAREPAKLDSKTRENGSKTDNGPIDGTATHN